MFLSNVFILKSGCLFLKILEYSEKNTKDMKELPNESIEKTVATLTAKLRKYSKSQILYILLKQMRGTSSCRQYSAHKIIWFGLNMTITEMTQKLINLEYITFLRY